MFFKRRKKKYNLRPFDFSKVFDLNTAFDTLI